MTKATKRPTGKQPKPTGAMVAVEWIKQHPTALLAVAAATGISGEQIVQLAQEDLPGWALGGVVLLWAVIHWARTIANNVVALVQEFREFRDETRVRLQHGDGMLEAHDATLTAHGGRLDKLEAELIAYKEKRTREVKP